MKLSDDETIRPFATIDLAIFALSARGVDLLLTRSGGGSLAPRWVLPGGPILADADLEAAARRVLRERIGVETYYLEQLQSFGGPSRGPCGWSVSIVYVALIAADRASRCQGADAAAAAWHAIAGDGVAEPLAFDHAVIVKAAIGRLRSKAGYTTLPVHLLPAGFTLTELQSVYERLLGRRIDKSAFRKRIAEADFVEPVPGAMRRASNRPAQIYRLKPGCSTIFFDRTI